jgi:hypothetical protein
MIIGKNLIGRLESMIASTTNNFLYPAIKSVSMFEHVVDLFWLQVGIQKETYKVSARPHFV